MSRPLWFLNMCALTNWANPEISIYALGYWAHIVDEWLDQTRVIGNAEAMAVSRVLKRLFFRHCNFLKLQDNVHGLKKVARRLQGLVHD